jgi:hypothetical protein
MLVAMVQSLTTCAALTELGIWDYSLSAVHLRRVRMYQLVILDSVVDGRCCGYGTEGSASLRFHAAVTILTYSLRQENFCVTILSAGGHRVKPLPPVLQSLIRSYSHPVGNTTISRQAFSPGMDNSICLAVFEF